MRAARVCGMKWMIGVVVTVVTAGGALAAGPRALPSGQLPDDVRHQDPLDLDGYFPFEPPATRAEWERRAERVRRQVLVSQGLWPLPERTPLEPVIHGRLEAPGYTIEKVYFQAAPGFFVTGSLYRPTGEFKGRRPGVLCPHGHWPNGRFTDAGEAAAKQEVEQGAETSVEAGRSPLQARCVQLARLGCVVFHYDMIGYADSTQLSFELAHRFAKQRPEMNSPERWGLFSPQAEAHLQSIMGLQTWSSVRALDFLCGLDDVDSGRIAVTGASGGGTQTFMLCAIDSRPAVSFPAVMVSTAMQGGCTCENASDLRVGTGNVELAALFAPKPQGMTAADDWTVAMETKGFPQLRQLYGLYNAADRVALFPAIQFKHNYNKVSRLAMYGWLNQHLGLGATTPIDEADFPRRSAEQLTVWDAEHPRPAGGDDFERDLLSWWTADARRQLEARTPRDADSLRSFRELVGPAVDVVIGRDLPDAKLVEYEQTIKEDRGEHIEMAGVLHQRARHESSPIVFLFPKAWEGKVVIWLHPLGKQGLYGDDGRPVEPVRRLLAKGVAVSGIDLLFQGEHLREGTPPESTRRVKNPREAAAYTFGYNSTLFAQRVHDVLALISYVRAHEYQPKEIALVGLDGEAGAWAAAARAQARELVQRAAIDTRGFRFAQVRDLQSTAFLPGGAKYGDLPGMLALAAPAPLWLAGEQQVPGVLRAAYAAGGGEVQLSEQSSAAAVVDWLLQ